MTTLISPGVDVKIISEDYYVPGNSATLPLIFIATADEKVQADGITPALGTFESGVLRTVTSLKQSLALYGVPKFHESADGQAHHGDARNEYGLDALNKFLEVGNRAYVIRANINLNDNLTDIKALWATKLSDAADYLNRLAADWIAQYNELNNLVPADSGYKTSVPQSTMLTLIDEAMTDVFKSYSFSEDALQVAFLADHTNAQAGYQDILFQSGAGYLQSSDITGLETATSYQFKVEIVSGSGSLGTAVYTITSTGAQAVTYGQLIARINTAIGSAGTASLVQGRIRIKSSLTGVTSAVEITQDGATGFEPLLASLNVYEGLATPIAGKGILSLSVYDATYANVTGSYDGLTSLVTDWSTGSTVGATTEFTPAEAEGLLLAASADFDNTKEFKDSVALGANDAARRAEIVKALQAIVNSPNTNARSEALEYTLVTAPGYPELADELARLLTDMYEEVFAICETPFDKSPVGPNSIANWAVGTGRVTSEHVGYWYGHGISSNIDGANIMTSAGSTALRTIAYSDSVADEWFAPAGVARGGCPHLVDLGYVVGALGGPTTFVTEWLDNGTRDELYEFPKNINPITFIPGRGFLVMGQKTTSAAAQSMDRINVSRLVKFIKRQLRKSLFPYTFEPNDQITRNNIKAATDNFLSSLIDRRALYDFASICDETNNDGQAADTNSLFIDIAIKPVKAIEFIYARVHIVRSNADIGTKKSV